MSRTYRLFDLLQVLRRHRHPLSGESLARELGVSLRTLYRDIAVLQTMGAEIKGEPGVGYVLKPSFLLPPLMFSQAEIEALALGLKWVAKRTDEGMADAAGDAMAKLAAVLPGDLRDGLEDDALIIGPGRKRQQVVDMALLRRALHEEKKLKLQYRDEKGAETSRVIWPVTLGFFETTRVLVGWCELRGDFRHFRTDRIEAAALLADRSPKRRKVLHKEWRNILLTKLDSAACYSNVPSVNAQEDKMNTELVFYTNPQSRGNVVHWMLEEVGQPYRTEVVEYGPEMKSPSYLSINPMGKVPALKHGDTVVTETAAILCYLADTFPEAGLAPESTGRGDYYRWMFFASGCLEAAVSNHAVGWNPAADMQPRFGYGSYELVMNVITDAVRGKRHLADEGFSAVDLYVASYLDFLMRFDVIEKRPEFTAYCDPLINRPAALRAKDKIAALMSGEAWNSPK
jgi:predicted DNA-binding transcriptional regulator YafY